MTRTPTLLLALSLSPLLAACDREPAPAPAATAPAAAATEPRTVLGRTVDQAMRAARRELESGNLDLGDGMGIDFGSSGRHVRIGTASSGTKAQLTPKGDLLIEGKAVAITPEQRAMLLDYRGQIIAVAETGMDLGVEGADLAGKAVLETFSGLMHGDADQAGKRIEAEAKRLEADAKRICAQLSPMLATQQRLAASLPAFKPYANMTQSDIDDCLKGDGAAVTDRAQIRDEIRNEIRNGIRDGIRGSAQGDTRADASDADSKPASSTAR
jgi:hypothetical protein